MHFEKGGILAIYLCNYCGINISPVVHVSIQTWCEFKSRREKNKHLTAQRSNSNTVWFNFQTYIIFSINLVSQVTLRSGGADIVYGCHLLRCLYNIVRSSVILLLPLYTLFPLTVNNDFFIILYNIFEIAESDCCQIIILSIYVPSTHASTHVLCLSLDFQWCFICFV